MLICRIHRVVSLLIALAAVSLGGGCATQGEKVGQSFAHTRKAADEAKKQVDATLVSLHALRSTPADDLRDKFSSYKYAVEQLQEEGADSEARAALMRQEIQGSVEAWQKEVETLKDPAVKATMEARREAVRTNYKLVTMYAADARKAYGPFVEGNKELIRALSIDLTPAAVASLSASIDKVLLDGKALQQKLWMMQNGLNNIAAGVSPIGGPE